MVDITEQIVREAPEIEAYKLGLLKSAKALADQGVSLPAQQVAGMSGLQTAAIDQATAGIGGYQPYLCLLYTSPSPRDRTRSRMPSSA